MQKIARYKKEWFNPLFFILKNLIQENKELHTLMVYGGKGSAKTYSISQLLLTEAYAKASSTIALRKHSNTLQRSLKATFNETIKSLYFSEVTQVQKFNIIIDAITAMANITFSGLDDSEKFKGVEGVKYAYLDEANQFLYEEQEQISLSLRGQEGQILFMSWNPVSEMNYLKARIIDNIEWKETSHTLPDPESFVRISNCGGYALIKTTYKDNYFIVGSPCGTYGFKDKKLIKKYEDLKVTNFASYRVNVQGEWGKAITGGEFLYSFTQEGNVTEAKVIGRQSSLYNPEKPLYISLDDNVLPYITGLIFQIDTDKSGYNKAIQIDEVCIQYTEKWAEEFRRRYPVSFVKGLYITGDRTALKDDSKNEMGNNMYLSISRILHDYKPSIRLPSSNPSVEDSRTFLCDIFTGLQDNIDLKIASICKLSIYDYAYALQDDKGGVLKNIIRDKATKKSHQEHGHHCDALRYFVMQFFYSEFIKWKSNGIGGGHKVGKNTTTKLRY
jgi:phage terminase large subunit